MIDSDIIAVESQNYLIIVLILLFNTMKQTPITRANTTLPECLLLDKDTSSFTRNNTSANVAKLGYSSPLSRTEQELRSHSLINSILDNRRLRVVHHNLKSTYHHISLPQRYSQKVKTQAVDSQQHQLIPTHQKTIKSVYTEIAEPTTAKKGTRLTSSQKSQLVLDLQAEPKPPRICISALINYKFKSVKSQHRIALDPARVQSEMALEIQIAKARSQAQALRQRKIRAKSEASILDEAIQTSIFKSVKEGDTTSDYLKSIGRVKNKQLIVFGHRLKDYESLKKMSQQLKDFNQAELIIQHLRKTGEPPQAEVKRSSQRKHLRLQKQRRVFQRRKHPCSRKKVCSSSLLIMQDNDFR